MNDRRADLRGRCVDDLSQGPFFFFRPAVFLGHVAIDVLGHDDAHVGHVADGDRDSGEGHDVAVDAEVVHHDEAHRDREGQRRQDRQGAAEMQEKDDDDDARDERLLGERLAERVHRFVDNIRAVVEGNDLYGLGTSARNIDPQPGFDFGDLGLHALDDPERILAVAHRHDAANRLAAAFVEDSTAKVGAKLDRGDVLYEQRRAALLANHDVFYVANILNKTDAANEELVAVVLDDFRADIDVAALDRFIKFGQRHAMGMQLVRMNVDLILLHESADAGDL
jgi:hypothetical protein